MLKDSSFTISNLFPDTTHFNISFGTSFGTSLLLAKFSNAESLRRIYLVGIFKIFTCSQVGTLSRYQQKLSFSINFDKIVFLYCKNNFKCMLKCHFCLLYSTTAQKMKFSIKDFFSKCDQIRR